MLKVLCMQMFSDHMLVTEFAPETGWSAPVIQPYQNISLDPASSCFQYATSLFEGMKAYMGPDGEPFHVPGIPVRAFNRAVLAPTRAARDGEKGVPMLLRCSLELAEVV